MFSMMLQRRIKAYQLLTVHMMSIQISALAQGRSLARQAGAGLGCVIQKRSDGRRANYLRSMSSESSSIMFTPTLQPSEANTWLAVQAACAV